jgi:hypothetical protein
MKIKICKEVIMGFRNVRGSKGKKDSGVPDLRLGIPTDTSWEDGFFDEWQPETFINDAIDDISELLKLLAPEKADQLQITGHTTLYNAKLADGNNPEWYIDNKSPGDTINNYVINPNLNIETIHDDTSFRSGKFNDPSTFGILSLLKNDEELSGYDMTNGLGGNDIIQVTSLEQFNKIWTKANAEADLILTEEGYIAFKMEHTEAGESNIYTLYFDPSPGSLAFSNGPFVYIEVVNAKYLSGVEYLGLGSKLSVTFTGDTGIFQHAYHADHVGKIKCFAINDINVNPVIVPMYDDNFEIDSMLVTLDLPNKASNNPTMDIELHRPETMISESVNIPQRICTYGDISICSKEWFYDENRRLVKNTNTPWVSSDPLHNGDAQVNNGTLEYGSDDYPSKSGDQEYQRHFCKTAASTGFIQLKGISGSNVSPYGTGDLNVLLRLDNDNLYFDLGRVVGDKNGSGSGNDRANSIGGQVRFNGDTIEWSVGTNSTAYNDQQYRIIIIFRNNSRKITQIVTS